MQILFADQLGSHFTLDGEAVTILEVAGQFRKRRYHRQKAHLILSGIRHRAANGAELVKVDSYRDYQPPSGAVVVAPSSRAMRSLVEHWGIEQLPARGFASTEVEFATWLAGNPKKLVMEDFYRWQRSRLGILVEHTPSGIAPVGGQWNFDSDNRLPPPKTATLNLPDPWWPIEDDIDERVRWDLDRLADDGVQFLGVDGPRRFAVTEQEALEAANHFLDLRLDTFGPYEDAMLKSDWTMSHSLLSVPLNLGLLDPISLAREAESRLSAGTPIASIEGFVRQIIGWRDYVWHLYWQFGPEYLNLNAMNANESLPQSWANLKADTIEANCVKQSIADLTKYGWLHHIQRLMILANQAAQRAYQPLVVNEWFTDAFVDGTPWVMPANVIGMGLYADGGLMSTKPYIAGGAYISKMSNYCGECPFDPKKRLGEDACPFTAGYWNYLASNREAFAKNHRMFKPLAGLSRLTDLDAVVQQEADRSRF